MHWQIMVAFSGAGLAACASPPTPSPEAPPHSRSYAHHGHRQHRFDNPQAWAKRFEDPSRDVWQKPDVVIEALALSPASVVADIGSASGYFPVRIAPRVPQGRVWGVDIEPAMVHYLNERAREQNLGNLFSVLGTALDPLLPEPADAILVVNTYHHVEARERYFANLKSYLKPGGRLVIVDFKLGGLPVGPPDAMKIHPDRIARELATAGYRLVARQDETLPYQHVLVFQAAAVARLGPGPNPVPTPAP